MLSLLWAWAQPLVRELRSHKAWGMATERKTREETVESENSLDLFWGQSLDLLTQMMISLKILSMERSMLVKDMMGGGSKVISTLCSGSLCVGLALLFSGLSHLSSNPVIVQ